MSSFLPVGDRETTAQPQGLCAGAAGDGQQEIVTEGNRKVIDSFISLGGKVFKTGNMFQCGPHTHPVGTLCVGYPIKA
jgi:hypothetical protein